jgi:serine/threonine protein kinase
MLKAQSCPEGPLLQQFLLGQLPTDEIENWAQHVEQCGRCVEKLAGFQINDGLVETMAAAAVAREEPPAQILDGLVKRLSALWSRLTPHATEDGQPETPQESSSGSLTPEPCDFLAPAQQPDEIGRLGPYRVLQLLGSGGMGMVFQAEDPHLQRLVALKVMRPALAQRALARQRFLREARTAATFIHDHVVGIYQVGEDRGLPFLAMPLLPGESLEKRLKREGRLPVGTVLAIGRQVATALAAAHSRGLIHRDIKPANIWLETLPDGQGPLAPRERVKILDFGLARAIDSATHLTESGAFAGTPGYMAPEQVRGEPLDGRCDLFSLGCVLYRSCTGRLAFAGANPLATLRALELEQPQPPQLLNPEVPPDLSNLILRLLDKRAENRPLAAADLIQTLEGIERQLPVRPLPGPTALPASRRRFSLAARFLILAGGLLLVLGSLGYLVGPALLRMVVHRDDPVGETGQENGPNKGWKGFRPGGHFRTTGPNPHGLVAADLNGDGRLDLISPNLGSTTVSVLLGNGDGTFQDPISFETGTRPRNAVVADVNGDGKPDLVVVNGGDPEKRQKGSACILLGDGKGSFGKPVHIEFGFDPLGLVVID